MPLAKLFVNCLKEDLMEVVVKKSNKKTVPKGVVVFTKMLEDKKAISKHLKAGGTFDQLKKKGYRFATV